MVNAELEESRAAAHRIPVILDVDTGVDDAKALLLAALHPTLDLRAVTCVGGNAPLGHVVTNTLTVLDACSRGDVPVAAGADRPLLDEPERAGHVHGRDGLGDIDWARSTRDPDRRHAVELLRDLLLPLGEAAPEHRVTLVPLGPMTNIALLARTHPAALRGLREVVFMGGAADVGNVTASAEFNVFHDPEAAAIVLDACAEQGVPVRMYGLDVFYSVRVTRDQGEAMIRADPSRSGPAGIAGRLVRFACDRWESDSATVGDAGAVCAVIDPEGLRTERRPVRVELSGTWTRGRTIVDRRDWTGDLSHDPHGLATAMVDVGVEVAGGRYSRMWLDTVTGAR